MAALSKPDLTRSKRGVEITVSVSEYTANLLIAKAHSMGLTKADLAHECLILGLTGEIYSVHVANDKAEAIKAIHREVRENTGCE